MNTIKNSNNNIKINNDIILFANKLADISANIIKKYFRQDNIFNFEKDDNSPLTIVDTEVETILRAEIEKKYPEHHIAGEELNDVQGISPYKWYIDPIDGTSSFIMGIPVFTTLIALTYNGLPIFGLINQPINNERWQGGEIYQTNYNGTNLQIAKKNQLNQAILATTSPYLFNNTQLAKFDIIRKKTKYQKYGGAFIGGDAYLYAMLAMDKIDIIIEANLKPYDFLAPAAIIKAAGGVVTNWQGEKIDENSHGELLACNNKELHQVIIKLLN
jgi:inositol-phosphate phosphatase/L-galactose 1-phosphate phosphatase/histidinol-phosphatase